MGAVKEARIELDQVLYFTAGLPGYEQKKDLEWAIPLIEIDGLSCSIYSQ